MKCLLIVLLSIPLCVVGQTEPTSNQYTLQLSNEQQGTIIPLLVGMEVIVYLNADTQYQGRLHLFEEDAFQMTCRDQILRIALDRIKGIRIISNLQRHNSGYALITAGIAYTALSTILLSNRLLSSVPLLFGFFNPPLFLVLAPTLLPISAILIVLGSNRVNKKYRMRKGWVVESTLVNS